MKAALRGDRKKIPTQYEFRALSLADVLSPDFGRESLYYMGHDGRMGNVRRNGMVKTWKRDPNRVEIPVKFGMYEAFRVTDPSELFVMVGNARENPGLYGQWRVADAHGRVLYERDYRARDGELITYCVQVVQGGYEVTFRIPDSGKHGYVGQAKTRTGAFSMASRDARRRNFTRSNPRRKKYGAMRRMTVPERHQTKIARSTLLAPDAMVAVMGGMTKEQARRHLEEMHRKYGGAVYDLGDNPRRRFKANPMSRKDFEYMAAVIADQQLRGAPVNVTAALTDFAVELGKRSNPRFDPDRFARRIIQLVKEEAPYRYVNNPAVSESKTITEIIDDLKAVVRGPLEAGQYDAIKRVVFALSVLRSQAVQGVHKNPLLAVVGNPPGRMIGTVVGELRYRRTVGKHRGLYKHRFKTRDAKLFTMDDGSLRIVGH